VNRPEPLGPGQQPTSLGTLPRLMRPSLTPGRPHMPFQRLARSEGLEGSLVENSSESPRLSDLAIP